MDNFLASELGHCLTRELLRKGFGLRAVESVEKCSWECFREGTKSRPLVVWLVTT
jgi:hypothetical protein